MSDWNKLQDIIQYQYKDPQLLYRALVHRSYLNENHEVGQSNERMEFLGDAVLELVTSEFLFKTFPDIPEGKLTNLRSQIVQTRTLATVAQTLHFGEYLMLSKGEAASSGAENVSILADTVEAVIGSVFLDQGFDAARKFVHTHILNNYQDLISQAEVEDYKSKLQEVVQSKGGSAPVYEVVKEEGPDHNRVFTIQVHFFDKPQTLGTGRSKQTAQQAAAKEALATLR